MPPDSLQHWGLGGMTQEELRTHRDSFTMPSHQTSHAYQQAMLANNAAVFGCPVANPYPFRPARDANLPPGRPVSNHLGSFYNVSEPSSQVAPTPVSNASTADATSTPTTLNFSWPRSYSQAMSIDSPPLQPQTVEPHALSQNQSVPSGAPWQVPPFSPFDFQTPHCPVATSTYNQVPGQLSTPPINPNAFLQPRIPGPTLASIHPESTSAFMQTQMRANSFFGMTPAASTIGYSGMNPQSPGGSSVGTHAVFANASETSQTMSFIPPLNDENTPIPSGSLGGASWRNRRRRYRNELSSGSSSNSVSRHALPKGLDDPLDKRPKPKETAEMTLNMECKVCMSQPVDTAVFPCGHAMFCRWCAEQCMPSHRHDRSRLREPTRCPVCRCFVRQKMRIFLP